MNLLKNDRYLKALFKQNVDKTPVWMMRQAGRHLPEYRELRKKAGNFMTLCSTPELAAEATLQPIKRYDLDAAILFSDILTIPDAMGMELYFQPGEGPKFKQKVDNFLAIQKLPIPDPNEKLKYVTDAILLTKKQLDFRLPLIGFSGSPWTIATYMIEGGSSKTFAKIKKLMYENSTYLHILLEKLTESIILYLNAQIEAGIDSIMIFDSWGGVLTSRDYREFSLNYMHKIVENLNRNYQGKRIPITLFTKGGGFWLEEIAKTGCDAIGLDWTIDLLDAKKRVGDKVALQGNMEPSILFGSFSRIEQEVEHILSEFGYQNGHIFNLGHGIDKGVLPENANHFINSVHKFSEKYHQK